MRDGSRAPAERGSRAPAERDAGARARSHLRVVKGDPSAEWIEHAVGSRAGSLTPPERDVVLRMLQRSTVGAVPPGLKTPCVVFRDRYLDRDLYPKTISYRGRDLRPYRLALAIALGLESLAPDVEAHHLCPSRGCWAAPHLSPLPRSEHRRLRRERCWSCATPYAPDAPLDSRGSQVCATCRAEREARRRARRAGACATGVAQLRRGREPAQLVEAFRARVREVFPGACFPASTLPRDVKLVRDHWCRSFRHSEVRRFLDAAVRDWDGLVRDLADQGFLRWDLESGWIAAPRRPSLTFLTRHMAAVVEWARERGAPLDEPPAPELPAREARDLVARAWSAWSAAAAPTFVRTFTRAQARAVERYAAGLRAAYEADDLLPAVLAAAAAEWKDYAEHAARCRGRDPARVPRRPDTAYVVEHVAEAIDFAFREADR